MIERMIASFILVEEDSAASQVMRGDDVASQ
jgi:hypothetical protein